MNRVMNRKSSPRPAAASARRELVQALVEPETLAWIDQQASGRGWKRGPFLRWLLGRTDVRAIVEGATAGRRSR